MLIPAELLELVVAFVGSDLLTEFLQRHGEEIPLHNLVINPASPLTYILTKLPLCTNSYLESHAMPALCSRKDLPLDFLIQYKQMLKLSFIFTNSSTPRSFIEENKPGKDCDDYYDYLHYPRHSQKLILSEISRISALIEAPPRSRSMEKRLLDLRRHCFEAPALFAGPIKNIKATMQKWRLEMKDYAPEFSANERAPLGFFLFHPEAIYWDSLSGNAGRLWKAKKARLFLRKHQDRINWYEFSGNEVPSPRLFLDHRARLKLGILCGNATMPFQFFADNIAPLESELFDKSGEARYHRRVYALLDNPSIPFPYIQAVLSGKHREKALLCRAYDIPVENVLSRVDDGSINWKILALNRGFWARNVRHELLPVLKRVFGHLSTETLHPTSGGHKLEVS